jgi:hypothetical protein
VVDLAQDTIDYIGITRLQAVYGDVVNRRAWPEFHDLFLPDAHVRIDTVTNPVVEANGPAELAEFIGGAVERFEFFEFVVLNARVEIGRDGDPDAAWARVFMCELRQEAASGRFTTAFGVYHDDYARVGGRWWFARRRYQSLARSGRGEVFPFPDEAQERSRGAVAEGPVAERSDPSKA